MLFKCLTANSCQNIKAWPLAWNRTHTQLSNTGGQTLDYAYSVSYDMKQHRPSIGPLPGYSDIEIEVSTLKIIVHASAAKLAEKRGSEDRKIGTAMICRSLGIGMIGIGSVISRINTNSTQISIARTTATVILACHRSQQCWFQFRKTTKFF